MNRPLTQKELMLNRSHPWKLPPENYVAASAIGVLVEGTASPANVRWAADWAAALTKP